MSDIESSAAATSRNDRLGHQLGDQLEKVYRRYLTACNGRRLDQVANHLAVKVLVNAQTRTRDQYVADLQQLWDAFPDYRWNLQQVVVEPPWLAVRLEDHGTRTGQFLDASGDGAAVHTAEFAMYRFDEELRVAEIWVTADNWRLTR